MQKQGPDSGPGICAKLLGSLVLTKLLQSDIDKGPAIVLTKLLQSDTQMVGVVFVGCYSFAVTWGILSALKAPPHHAHRQTDRHAHTHTHTHTNKHTHTHTHTHTWGILSALKAPPHLSLSLAPSHLALSLSLPPPFSPSLSPTLS